MDRGKGDKINHNIHGIGFILKKLLMIEFMSGLERTFTRLFVKNFPKLGWRECDSETECPLARPFCWISPIGASNTLGNRANRKGELFKGFLQEMSSGHMKLILRGIQCKCFQVMSLLTGPRMSPPVCGRGVTGTVTNGDKLLCNTFTNAKDCF